LTPDFRNIFMDVIHATKRSITCAEKSSDIIDAFQTLIRSMHNSTKASVDMAILRRYISFCSCMRKLFIHNFVRLRKSLAPEYQENRQQDASEFVHYLLDELCSHAGKVTEKYLHSIFTGKYIREITCLNCCAKSQTHEEFLDINVPIPEHHLCGSLNLASLLKDTLNPEILTGRYV